MAIRNSFFCAHFTSSDSLSYFILAVPMCECLGKQWCMSSPFPIAILNGTFFFSGNEMIEWLKCHMLKTNFNNNNNNNIRSVNIIYHVIILSTFFMFPTFLNIVLFHG